MVGESVLLFAKKFWTFPREFPSLLPLLFTDFEDCSPRYTGPNRDISVRYRCSENEMSLSEFRRVFGPLHLNRRVAKFATLWLTNKAEALCLGFIRWYARRRNKLRRQSYSQMSLVTPTETRCATPLTPDLHAKRESLGVSAVNPILVMRGVRTSIGSRTLAKIPTFRLARGVGLSSEFGELTVGGAAMIMFKLSRL